MKNGTGKQHKKNALFPALILILMAALFCCGCARQQATLDPNVTLPPAATPTPKPTPAPTPELTPTPESALPTPTPVQVNYWEYLSFQNIYVYEESEDTFFEGVVESEYPGSLIAVLDVFFYDDEEKEIARGRLLNGEGEDVLIFTPGENRIYARVDTDMSITMLDFGFESVGDPLTALD